LWLDDLHHHYQQRIDETNFVSETSDLALSEYGQYRALAAQLRAVERAMLERLRNEKRFNDEVLRALEQDLDLLDTRYLVR
jgi:CPA1 family monovalent cation:H+ antiporter